jgi:hypothetical protein
MLFERGRDRDTATDAHNVITMRREELMTLGPLWKRRLSGLLGSPRAWHRLAELRSSKSGGQKIVEAEIARLIKEKDWHPVLSYIYFLADDERDLKEARRLYHKYFGPRIIRRALRAQPDKRSWPRKLDQIVDALIERCFLDDFYEGRREVSLPPELVVGLIVREGFAGRPRAKAKSYGQVGADAFAIESFRKRKRELMAPPRKLSAREAEDIAAEELKETTTLSKAALIEGRPHRRRPPRSGR